LSSTNIYKILIATSLLIISSYISFDIDLSTLNIPISAQSLAVILISYILRLRKGMIAVGLYLLLGAVGLPVFSDFKSGLNILTGPSGGYLYGFLLSVFLMETVFVKLRGKEFWRIFTYMLVATVLILFFGGLHLSFSYNLEIVMNSGIIPFLPGAFIKILIATMIVYYLEAKNHL